MITRIFYDVHAIDKQADLWYDPLARRWLDGYDRSRSVQSWASRNTFKAAIRCANQLAHISPSRTARITRWWHHHGKRVCRDFVLTAH